MDNVLKTIHTGFSCRSATLIQSLEDSGIKRGDDGELIFPVTLTNVFRLGVSASVWHLMAGAGSV